jgi:hypothetical protein
MIFKVFKIIAKVKRQLADKTARDRSNPFCHDIATATLLAKLIAVRGK